MNDIELEDFDFAEVGNNQQNIWRLRDELNATRRWLRANTVFEEDIPVPIALELKPGVKMTKNGRYIKEGVGFISKDEAFV